MSGVRKEPRPVRVLQMLRPIVAVVLALLFFAPIYLIVINVFKTESQILSAPAAFPAPFSLESMIDVLTRADQLLWIGLINSAQITVFSVVGTVLSAAMLGYYLARATGRIPAIAMLVLLAGLTIPTAVLLSALTQVLDRLGLMQSVMGVVVSNIGYFIPFGVFVFMGFVRTVPIELEEAATLDGAGRFRTFWQIVFPLMKPATASVVIFLGVWVWNDFLNPLIILGPSSGTTVTVGVYRAIGERSADFGQLFSFMTLATLPVVALFLVFQKSFIKGLTGGASR